MRRAAVIGAVVLGLVSISAPAHAAGNDGGAATEAYTLVSGGLLSGYQVHEVVWQGAWHLDGITWIGDLNGSGWADNGTWWFNLVGNSLQGVHLTVACNGFFTPGELAPTSDLSCRFHLAGKPDVTLALQHEETKKTELDRDYGRYHGVVQSLPVQQD